MKNKASLLIPIFVLFVGATNAPQLKADSNTQALVAPSSAKELIDPTQPNWFGLKTAKKKNANTLRLDSLVRGSQRRLAVINGVMMREGDTKNGITVQSIFEDRVLVRTQTGKKHTLKLKTSNKLVNTKNTGSTRVNKETTR